MFELPDWKNSHHYPEPGRTSNEHFAWEFLRRNPDYQRDWVEYRERLLSATRGDPEASRYARIFTAADGEVSKEDREWSHLPETIRNVFMKDGWPPRSTWETVRVESASVSEMNPAVYFGRRWGLRSIVHPNDPYNLNVSFEQSKEIRIPSVSSLLKLTKKAAADTGARESTALERTKWVILQIDLEKPHEVLIEQISRHLKAQRMFRKRAGYISPLEKRARDSALWVSYLRILDGVSAGVSFAEIGAELHPGKINTSTESQRTKAVRENYKAACKLRDSGYRYLPMLADKISKKAMEPK